MYKLTTEGNFFVAIDNATSDEFIRHPKSNIGFRVDSGDTIILYGLNRVLNNNTDLTLANTLDSTGTAFVDFDALKAWCSENFNSPQVRGFDASIDLGVERIFESQSVNEQNPTGTGVSGAIQVEFGGPVTTPYVSLDVLGTLTFHVAGTYRIKNSFQFGREGTNAGTVKALFGIFTPSGTQLGRSLYQEIRDTNVDYYLEVDTILDAPAGLQLKGMLMRDDDGVDQGGLIPFQPTVDGGNEWNAAPSAFLRLERYVNK